MSDFKRNDVVPDLLVNASGQMADQKSMMAFIVKTINEYFSKTDGQLLGTYDGMNLAAIQAKLLEIWNKGKTEQEAILTILVQQIRGGGNMASAKSQKLVGWPKIRAAMAAIGCLYGAEAGSRQGGAGPLANDALTPSRIGIAMHPAIVSILNTYPTTKKGADISYGDMPALFCSVWGAYAIDPTTPKGKYVMLAHLEWSLKHNSVINFRSKAKFNVQIWNQRMATSQVSANNRKNLTEGFYDRLNASGLVPGQVIGWTDATPADLTAMKVPRNFWPRGRSDPFGFGSSSASAASFTPSAYATEDEDIEGMSTSSASEDVFGSTGGGTSAAAGLAPAKGKKKLPPTDPAKL